jgi:hypothetical protein
VPALSRGQLGHLRPAPKDGRRTHHNLGECRTHLWMRQPAPAVGTKSPCLDNLATPITKRENLVLTGSQNALDFDLPRHELVHRRRATCGTARPGPFVIEHKLGNVILVLQDPGQNFGVTDPHQYAKSIHVHLEPVPLSKQDFWRLEPAGHKRADN